MEALPRLNVMFTVDSPGHRGPQPILIIPRVAAGGRAMARPRISDLRTRRRRPLSSRRCDPDASLGGLSGRTHPQWERLAILESPAPIRFQILTPTAYFPSNKAPGSKPTNAPA